MMRFARQITAHEAIVAEAAQCAEMLEPTSNKICKKILQQTITDRSREIADMRATLARLADMLVDIPIESS
jgi:hypothetical protein